MILIYIVAPGREEAESITRELIKSKLAFSANILPDVFSIRMGENGMEEYTETLVLIKTRAHLYTEVEKKVLEIRGNGNPMIFSLPITQISHDLFSRIQNYTNSD